jgi:hypothetical protein
MSFLDWARGTQADAQSVTHRPAPSSKASRTANPTLDDSLRFAEQHVGDILHTPKSRDGAAYRFIVRGIGRFGDGARSGSPSEVLAATRREAELRRLHAVATSIASYLEERIEAETPLSAG